MRYMRNMQIAGRLLLVSLVALPLFLVIAVVSYRELDRHKSAADTLGVRLRIIDAASNTIADFSKLQTGLAASPDNTGPSGTEPQRAAAAVAPLKTLAAEAGLTAEEKKRLTAAVRAADAYAGIAAGSGPAAAGERYATAIAGLRALISVEQNAVQRSSEQDIASARTVQSVIVVLFVVAVVISISFNIFIMRRKVIAPIRAIEHAARKVAQGSLSFEVEEAGSDEIGRAVVFLRESFAGLEAVLERIKELSERILQVVGEVERESENVLKCAEAEEEAMQNISSSVGELNATTAEISDSTQGLASSADDASASLEQLVSSIRHIDEIIHDLSGNVASTTNSIGQLSGSVQEVATHSGRLQAASEETLSAITEIAAAIREVESNAKDSARLSEKVTSDAATIGMTSIIKTIDGIKAIASSFRETEECIRILGNRSNEIEGILHVIETVNDETTLLSLNASILADQAGVHGRGFAVVANEIKTLSDRTEASTQEIAQLIRAVQQEIVNAEQKMAHGVSAVAEGLRLARDGEAALKKILSSSRQSTEMTLSIKRSTEEQARSALLVEESTVSIRNMISEVAQETADQSKGALQIAAAAEKMQLLAKQVGTATGEQAKSSQLIAQSTERVSDQSHQISRSLIEHKKGSQDILGSLEAVKHIPAENKKLSFRITKTLWNLQKDAELLKAEMERFTFSGKRGQSLRLGVVPLKEPSVMFRKFTPFAEFLSRTLNRKVDLKVAVDMESAVRDIGSNETQICAMGPANYLEANSNYGVTVIAKALRKGRPYHFAAVIVKDTSPIKTLSDLRGRRFAFGSVGSSTGHILPLATLKDAGVMREDLGHYEFLGHHDNLIKAVLSGAVDASCVIDEVAQSYVGKGLRILGLSTEIPEFNICCNPSVDKQTRKTIVDALVALDVTKPEDAKILSSLGKDCTGFVPAYDEEYQVFREKTSGIEAAVAAEHVRSR